MKAPPVRQRLRDVLQRYVLPYGTSEHVDAVLSTVEGSNGSGAAALPDDLELAINRLLYECAGCHQDVESRWLAAEVAIFRELASGRPFRRAYRIRQTLHFLRGARGGLHLFVPIPRDIPGRQHVTLTRAHPEEITRYVVPSSGQLYGVPILVEAGRPVPRIEIEVTVEQWLPVLLSPAPRIAARQPTIPPETSRAVQGWLEKVGCAASVAPGEGAAEGVVSRIVTAMEDDFEYAVTFAHPMDGSAGKLPELRYGSVRTLCDFLAAALQTLGFSARVGAAQRLRLQGGQSTHRYPGSMGYDHSYVTWAHAATGTFGTVDLDYFRRWGFASTEENTPDADLRARLEAVGEQGRSWMTRALYPLDIVVSSALPASVLLDFDTRTFAPARFIADTEIVADALPAEHG